MAVAAQEIWRVGQIDVIYERKFDGGGTSLARPLVEFIRRHFGDERRFDAALEWCCGPAFFGFALLSEDLCESLCLVDINPAAIDCVQKSIGANQLEHRVRAYVSDNMASVPKHERFDLVVANPPWYYEINSAHPLFPVIIPTDQAGLLQRDPGWRIHEKFYDQIASFLNPGALLLVVESEPHNREVVMYGHPWDVRPEVPSVVFQEMIRRGGLTHVSDDHLWTDEYNGQQVWVQISQKPN